MMLLKDLNMQWLGCWVVVVCVMFGSCFSADSVILPSSSIDINELESLINKTLMLIDSASYKEKAVLYQALVPLMDLKNDTKMMEKVSWAKLLGNYLDVDWNSAYLLLSGLSQNGSTFGQLGIGFMNAVGIGMESNQSIAYLNFMFSAFGGNPIAQMIMGYRYSTGILVPQSCDMALNFYRKAATYVKDQLKLTGGAAVQRIHIYDEVENQGSDGLSTQNIMAQIDDDLINYYQLLAYKGDHSAQLSLGRLYLMGGQGIDVNYDTAFQYFEMAANAGSEAGAAYLGLMYLEGNSRVDRNHTLALKYFKKAAMAENTVGLWGLGIMTYHGYGMEKRNEKEGVRLLVKAADQGSTDAQALLGTLFRDGEHVQQNIGVAVKYFRQAAQNGNVAALYHLADLHAVGHRGVSHSCQIATELFKNVAERGPWAQQLMEAYWLYSGGTSAFSLSVQKKRPFEATLLYMLLAEMGYETAEANAAYLLESGAAKQGFNHTEALKRALVYWQRSANQGYVNARVKLGDFHYYGSGVPTDFAQAVLHYKQAGELKSAQALFNLGYMHQFGLGIPSDFELAKRFYDQAADASRDATLPVTMALLRLYFDRHFNQLYRKFMYLIGKGPYPVEVSTVTETVGMTGADEMDSDDEEAPGWLTDMMSTFDLRLMFGPRWYATVMKLVLLTIGVVAVVLRYETQRRNPNGAPPAQQARRVVVVVRAQQDRPEGGNAANAPGTSGETSNNGSTTTSVEGGATPTQGETKKSAETPAEDEKKKGDIAAKCVEAEQPGPSKKEGQGVSGTSKKVEVRDVPIPDTGGLKTQEEFQAFVRAKRAARFGNNGKSAASS